MFSAYDMLMMFGIGIATGAIIRALGTYASAKRP